MISNASIARSKKGSKFWIQTLVNLNNGLILTNAIKKASNNTGNINWLSPIKSNSYKELRAYDIDKIHSYGNGFWPNNGPWWDAIGVDENNRFYLVECKSHIKETSTKSTAKNPISIAKINKSIEHTHKTLSPNHPYSYDVWINEYYQLANRLTFLVKLREKGLDVKLILLNIVDDVTHIKTSSEQWDNHYNLVFTKMIGSTHIPDNIININLQV